LAEKGMGRAGLQLQNDAVMQRPTVPIKEGTLRGSGSVFVQNKLVGISSFGKPGKANTEHSESIPRGAIVAVVGFNTPYAAKLHEGVDFKFSEPSSGPKYLESKLIANKEIYMEIVANTIKEGGQ
ncbi:MAG: hypothetical protein NTZ48_06475, partial [Candidatus Omnitrophica bacterium]|nr:hypothetical protein [Candidatus Omnitrophota bacterium]